MVTFSLLQLDLLSYIFTKTVSLLIKQHICVSPYVRLVVRYCSSHVENRRVHVIHLYRRIYLRTVT